MSPQARSLWGCHWAADGHLYVPLCIAPYQQGAVAAVQLLAGIPSVVYGFFGMIVMVPAVQAMVKSDFFKTVLHVKSGKGMSLFTASLLLGIMILPTIITVSKTSLDAVPQSYYEGSLALGATHERSVFCAVLPAAKAA